MTAPETALKPWATGEFDLSALFRTSVRFLDYEQILDDIERETRRARKSLGSRFIVMLLNLDEYGATVERGGAQAGKDMLKAIGDRVSILLSPHDAIANLGAGRIAILADTSAHIGSMEEFAQQIQRELMSGIVVADRHLEIGSSIGIVMVTGAHLTPDEILGNAAIAMSIASREGPMRAVTFHNWMAETEILPEMEKTIPAIAT